MENKIVFRCKPAYNFQSVEFEITGDITDIENVMIVYKDILDRLIAIAPEQPGKPTSGKPREPLATDKQKAIMDKFNIKYGPTMTKSEAHGLIQKSIEKASSDTPDW